MMTSNTSAILHTLQNTQTPVDWQSLLVDILKTFDCSTGTIHFLDSSDNLLKIKACQGIPDFLLPKMSVIPIGKGMAGVAAERRKPVQICNLQTDDSGVVRPSAKDTKMEGSIAVPLMLDGKLYGTLGVAKPVPYDFTDEETNELMKIGEEMSRRIFAN